MKMDKSEGLHQFNLKQKAFHALNDKLNERRLLALQLLNKYMVKKNWKTKSKYFKTFKKIIKNKKFQKQRADDFHILCLLSKGIRGFKHNKMNLK